VPGVPVYLFAGIIIADKCPLGPAGLRCNTLHSIPSRLGGCVAGRLLRGFEAGAGIAIAVGFLLKLMACAMQQPPSQPRNPRIPPSHLDPPPRKLIGERLGANLTIRTQARTCLWSFASL